MRSATYDLRTVRYNVIDGNGEGVIFGDLGASNNEVAFNIITNSVVRYNVETYWGTAAVGTGNSLHDNCVFTTVSGAYGMNGGLMTPLTGVDTVAGNVIANPMFTNAAARNYSLRVGSPCVAMGPR